MAIFIPIHKQRHIVGYAIVDAEDADAMDYRWTEDKDGYPRRTTATAAWKPGVRYLHRAVFMPPNGLVCDHINRVKFDSRRNNLRAVTRAQNQHNIGSRSNNTSGYRGVVWKKTRLKWEARVKVGGVRRSLGLFDDAAEAGRAAERGRAELGFLTDRRTA